MPVWDLTDQSDTALSTLGILTYVGFICLLAFLIWYYYKGRDGV